MSEHGPAVEKLIELSLVTHVEGYTRKVKGKLIPVDGYTRDGGAHKADSGGFIVRAMTAFDRTSADQGRAEAYGAKAPGQHKKLSDDAVEQFPAITRDLFSNPETPRTRGVTREEFSALAKRGKEKMDALRAKAAEPKGLDKHWPEIQAKAYEAVQQPWGGMTVDAHTGEAVPDGANKFALSVKAPDLDSVSVPATASEEEFKSALQAARMKFDKELRSQQTYLGIFHDDDNGRIDIDSVLVVDSVDDVETIGAYTHAVGGAYSFADGNGYWPPYVDEETNVTKALKSAQGKEGLQGAGSVALAGHRGSEEGNQEAVERLILLTRIDTRT